MEDKEALIFYKKVGQRIAKLRIDLNLTQEQLGQKIGLKQQAVANYETARRKLPLSLLKSFANALCVEINDLLDIKKTDKPEPLQKK